MGNLPFANIHNFDDLWSNQYNSSREVDPTSKLPVKKSIFRKRKVPDAENGALEAFQRELVDEFAALYYSRFPTSATVQASDRFGKIDAEAIGAYLHQINSKEELRIIIGGEFFDGQLDWLMERINIYNAVIRDEIQTGQATRAKKPRLQGVKASVQEQDLGQPTAARKLEMDMKEKRKLQIAAIMAEGRAASNTLGSYMLSDISPSSSESRSPS
ncbi:hypothetical protein PtB15_2B237 [Puccinia triticina]|nr:hypothetical protein PtB15_2B237 [Puccinia triticina]